MYTLLLIYKEREGHCYVPMAHREKVNMIGQWLQKQRKYKKHRRLDKDQEDRLTNLDVLWDEKLWNEYSILVLYKEEHGHCNVGYGYYGGYPTPHVGINLYMWLDTKRQEREKGKLDKHLEERMTNLGVVWDSCAKKLDDMCNLLSQYKQREGNCNVPKTQALGRWLDGHRQSKKRGVLDVDLEERLTNIGVEWDPLAKQWYDIYSLLSQHKVKEE